MKNKICSTFLCLLLTILSFGQVSKEAINKSRDYINYKLTNYCIEKFVSSPDGTVKDSVYETLKPKFTKKTFDDTLNYNNLSKLISKDFPTIKSKLSQNINRLNFVYLNTKTPEEAADSIITKSFEVYNEKYGERFPIDNATVQSSLKEEVLTFLIKSVPLVVPPTTPNVSPDNAANQTGNEIQNGTKNNEKGFFSFSHLNFWNLLSLLLIIGVLIFFNFKISNIHDRIDRRKKITDDDATPNRFLTNDNYSKTARADVEKFLMNSDKISVINSQIQDLQRRLFLLEAGDVYQSALPPKISTTENKPPAEDIFYMMKPVDDYFPNSNKSYQKNDTVYKFTVKSNKTEALFEIHTGGAPVNDIAKRNEAYIKPACEEENMPGTLVNNIITKRKGVASLEGDKWMIKSKAIIRYE